MDNKASDESQPYPSDLPEVVPNTYYPESYAYVRNRSEPGLVPAKYLAYDQTQKEVDPRNVVSPVSPKNPSSERPQPPTPDGGYEDHEKAQTAKSTLTVCGCPRRLVWLILFLGCIIIVLAAVGGGVGGALALRSQRDSSAQSAASTSATPSTASTTTASTTAAADASAETAGPLINTTQTFSFQAYENLSYQGRATPIYHKVGGFSFGYNVTSYIWKHDDDKVCCTTFCTGHKWDGWRCSTFYQPNATGPFDNIVIGCGNESEENSRLKC